MTWSIKILTPCSAKRLLLFQKVFVSGDTGWIWSADSVKFNKLASPVWHQPLKSPHYVTTVSLLRVLLNNSHKPAALWAEEGKSFYNCGHNLWDVISKYHRTEHMLKITFMQSSVNMLIFASLIQKGCADVARQNPLETFYDRLTNLPVIISQSCSQPSMTWPPTQALEQTWRWQDLKQTEQIWCNCLKLKTFARVWSAHQKCSV